MMYTVFIVNYLFDKKSSNWEHKKDFRVLLPGGHEIQMVGYCPKSPLGGDKRIAR